MRRNRRPEPASPSMASHVSVSMSAEPLPGAQSPNDKGTAPPLLTKPRTTPWLALAAASGACAAFNGVFAKLSAFHPIPSHNLRPPQLTNPP